MKTRIGDESVLTTLSFYRVLFLICFLAIVCLGVIHQLIQSRNNQDAVTVMRRIDAVLSIIVEHWGEPADVVREKLKSVIRKVR